MVKGPPKFVRLGSLINGISFYPQHSNPSSSSLPWSIERRRCKTISFNSSGFLVRRQATMPIGIAGTRLLAGSVSPLIIKPVKRKSPAFASQNLDFSKDGIKDIAIGVLSFLSTPVNSLSKIVPQLLTACGLQLIPEKQLPWAFAFGMLFVVILAKFFGNWFTWRMRMTTAPTPNSTLMLTGGNDTTPDRNWIIPSTTPTTATDCREMVSTVHREMVSIVQTQRGSHLMVNVQGCHDGLHLSAQSPSPKGATVSVNLPANWSLTLGVDTNPPQFQHRMREV